MQDETYERMSLERTTDLAFLEENMMGEADLIVEVIDLYLEQVPDFLTALRVALQEEDWKQIKFQAHKMRSSAVTVGAMKLADVLDAVERRALADPEKEAVLGLIERAEKLGRASMRELEEARLGYEAQA